MTETIVVCVECGKKLKEQYALIMQHDPARYKCIDCYEKMLDEQKLIRVENARENNKCIKTQQLD